MVEGSEPRQKKRNWISGFLISSIALYLALRGIKAERILDALQGAEYSLLIPSAAVVVAGLFARARSWHILLDEKVPFKRSFAALNEGYLLNMVLPLRLGEIARAYLVTRNTDLGVGWTGATVLIERIIDVAVCFLGLLVVLPFMVQVEWLSNLVLAVGAGLLLVLIIMFLLLRKRTTFQAILTGIPLLKKWFPAQLWNDFFEGIEGSNRGAKIARAAFWSLLAWLTAWLQILINLKMFHLGWTPIVSLFVTGVTAFGAAVPALPGAVGVYEFSAVAGFLVFGYEQEVALSIAVINHLTQLGITGLLGAIALSSEGNTIAEIGRQINPLLSSRNGTSE